MSVAKIVGTFTVKLDQAAKDTDPHLCSDVNIRVNQDSATERVMEVFSFEDLGHNPKNAEVEAAFGLLGLERPRQEHAIRFTNQLRNMPPEGMAVTFYVPPEDMDSSLRSKRCVFTLWRDTVLPYKSRKIGRASCRERV